jgi:endonuclease/exonuclease/phosphatase family metal-dependent hydrolase
MGELRVMTFNIRYDTAEDGLNAWPYRKGAAFEAIRRFDPHVFGVQEAQDHQMVEFVDEFPEYGFVGIGRDDGVRAGDFAAIFYQRTRLVPIESDTFWFSATPTVPGSRHPECFHCRICTWARFEDRQGQSFVMYNLHLDHESQNAREEAVAQLIPVLRRDLPSIVTGDFNAGESNPAIQAMRAAGFIDSYRLIHPDEEEVSTFHAYGTPDHPDKIDYIWVDKNWKVLDAEIMRGQISGAWPSDHHPVTATLLDP